MREFCDADLEKAPGGLIKMSEEILNAKILFGSGDIPEYDNEAVKSRISTIKSELKDLTCSISKTDAALAATTGIIASLVNTALKGNFKGGGEWQSVEKCKAAVTSLCQKIPLIKINDFDDAARFLMGVGIAADKMMEKKLGVSASGTYQQTKEDFAGKAGNLFTKRGGNEFLRTWLNDAAGIEVGLDSNGKGTLKYSNAKPLTGERIINATSNVAAAWFLGQCARPIDLIPDDYKPFAALIGSQIDKEAMASEISKTLNKTKVAKKIGEVSKFDFSDFRDKVMTAAPSVLVNEAILRGIYAAEVAIRRQRAPEPTVIDASGETIEDETRDIFEDRNFKRMRTIASSTLSFFDGGDAAARAALTCGGNIWGFLGAFAVNVNYVAAGDAAVSIYKDSVSEMAEQENLKELGDLKEQYAEEYVPSLIAYREKLEEDLGKFVEDEATDILTRLSDMKDAADNNDSDSFIKYNVEIQEKNGADVQFRNQEEFDKLMDSDEPLQF